MGRVHTRPGLFALLLIAATLLASGCGERADRFARRPNVSRIDDEPWHELRSPDFVLYSNGKTKDLETFARDLSRFIAVVDRLVDSKPPKTGANIFLLDEHAEDLFLGDHRAIGVMFTSLTGFDGLVRGVEHDPVRRGTFLHEFTHYLTLRGNELDLPTWYTEGFAEFLETTRARHDVMEIGSVPAWRLRTLDDRISRGRDIDLKPIFAHRRDGRTHDPNHLYPIAWATVHYLSSNADLHARMMRMIELQARGMNWRKAYARSFDEPVEELSRRVQAHVEILIGGTPGTIGYLPIEELDVRTDFVLREVPAAEAAYLLGELALRGATLRSAAADRRLAEALFRHSLALDPDDSRIQAALAYTYSVEDDPARAEPYLTAFRADPDPSVEALLNAGNALRAQAARATDDDPPDRARRLQASAMEIYERALRIEPRNPAALAGLGVTQLELGEIDEARSTLARAQSLGEWDDELTLERGRVEQKAGNVDRARRYLTQVIRYGRAETADRAREVLREMYGE